VQDELANGEQEEKTLANVAVLSSKWEIAYVLSALKLAKGAVL